MTKIIILGLICLAAITGCGSSKEDKAKAKAYEIILQLQSSGMMRPLNGTEIVNVSEWLKGQILTDDF